MIYILHQTLLGREKCAGHVARMGYIRNIYILIERNEGKRPLERYTGRWRGNIKVNLK
jgi:hypothetical protein